MNLTALGVTPLVARLLAARGWSEGAAVVEFLYPRLEQTHSPWLLQGMEAAVTRTLQAVAASETILILGDYDADGTLATVILRQALGSLGAKVRYQLPERLGGGYGLQPETMERAAAAGVGLAITVDNGIREHAALERARELGLDVIVTDHHLPAASLPPALAILNPHQPGCTYPDKGLCGSGVAFKLAQALLERSGKLERESDREKGPGWGPTLRSYLKLVAIATVADAAPLLGENRVFTRFGLEGLRQPVNPGLRALLGLALPPGRSEVTSRDLAFGIAPRLNAAGRMGAADRAVELFFAPAGEAAAAALALEEANRERKRCCEAIMAEIARLGAATVDSSGGVQVFAGAGWHRGVLGIAASRVLAASGRAVLIIALADGLAYGSGRAPAGVALLEMLEGCSELFDRFGGHAQAVGFTMAAEKLGALEAYLRRAAAPAAAVPAAPAHTQAFELSLGELTPQACQELARMAPFGEGNPEPEFQARGVRLVAAPQVLKEKHLKLAVEQDGVRHTALYWNFPHPEMAALGAGAKLDLVFGVETSRHDRYGERTQLMVRRLYAAADSSLAAAGGSVIA